MNNQHDNKNNDRTAESPANNGQGSRRQGKTFFVSSQRAGFLAAGSHDPAAGDPIKPAPTGR